MVPGQPMVVVWSVTKKGHPGRVQMSYKTSYSWMKVNKTQASAETLGAGCG